VTRDGEFIAIVRFDSPESAQRNSQRPEQDAWWQRASQHLADVSFHNSSRVHTYKEGGSDDAGFVQVMQGRSSDPDRARELMAQDPDEWAAFRPDVIGSVAVGHESGGYTMAMYFTSEAEAREGERKEPPPELAAQMAEMNKLNIDEPEFYDLKQPWLYSP
jgi:hypothetical protein